MATIVIDYCDDEEEKKESGVLKEKTIVPNSGGKGIDYTKASDNLSPPRKKLKQDALNFPKLTKEEALNGKDNKVKQQNTSNTPIDDTKKKTDVPMLSPSKENTISNGGQHVASVTVTATPTQKNSKTPKKPSPALTKEEREKQRQEKESLKQEKMREIEERRKSKEEEKRKKEQDRLQKQAEKEKRENEKKIEKEKKEQERKEKEKQKEEERKKREEEKRKREEQKEAERKQKEAERKEKEDIKRQEEEKKRMKEEMEKRKKEKAANQFKSFFTKKTQAEKKTEEKKVEDCHRFVPFQVKPNMTLAPHIRRDAFDKEMVDQTLEKNIPDLDTYLKELSIKIANYKKPVLISRRQLRRENEQKCKLEAKDIEYGTKAKKPKLNSDTDNSPKEVVFINEDTNDNENSDDDEEEEDMSFIEDANQLMKTKFLKFSENTRPPYYGTWRKTSKFVSGRNPFGRDNEIFNYEIDSDEEWIDEPGEDCSDIGDDDEEDEKETEEDQDGFFVPHGYLSDDEGVNDVSDDECDEENDDTGKKLSKEASDGLREQEKLKSKVDSFEVMFNKKVKQRKPICIGVNFTNDSEEGNPILKNFVKVSLYYSSVGKEDVDMDTSIVGNEDNKKTSENGTPDLLAAMPQTIPEEGIPFLLKIVHGSTVGLKKMIQVFRKFWVDYTKLHHLSVRSNVSKRQVEKKIQLISTRAPNVELGKICYTVHPEVLAQYDLANLKLGTGLPELEKDSTEIKDNINSQKKTQNDKNNKAKITPQNIVSMPRNIEIIVNGCSSKSTVSEQSATVETSKLQTAGKEINDSDSICKIDITSMEVETILID